MLLFLKKLLSTKHKHQVKVNYFRLDPSTNKLAVYNNREARIKGFDLLIINDRDVVYEIHISSLKAQDGIILNLEDLKDKEGNPFQGRIQKIKALTSTGVERFVERDNHLKRY